MPIPIITHGFTEGLPSIPYAAQLLRATPWLLLLLALKYYFGGTRNRSERMMHSKVVMVTGGTSGIGASVVHELALRGAQIILLTKQSPSDLFLVDYIDDMRKNTGNQLIYAEQVDLSSLHSIRTFATKWIDNTPPRRLDMLLLLAGTAIPNSRDRKPTVDGLDEEWAVNYLGNFHLLSILSPALRVQPSHRDVRVIVASCTGYIGAKFDLETTNTSTTPPDSTLAGDDEKARITRTKNGLGKVQKPRPKPTSTTTAASNKRKIKNMFALSKLSLLVFAQAFQKHLNAYKRPDGLPPCTRVIAVDPGLTRTPGTRRWLTRGSLWGLLVYLLTWPVWWLVLKSPQQGAQSVLYAAMEAALGVGEGGYFVKECRQVDFARREVRDEEVARVLWEFSEKMVETREKESAVRRAVEKKEKEEEEESQKPSAAAKEQTPGSRRSRKGNK